MKNNKEFYEALRKSILDIPNIPLSNEDDYYDDLAGLGEDKMYYDSLVGSTIRERLNNSKVESKSVVIADTSGRDKLNPSNVEGVTSLDDIHGYRMRLKNGIMDDNVREKNLNDELGMNSGEGKLSRSIITEGFKNGSYSGINSSNRYSLYTVSEVLGDIGKYDEYDRKKALEVLFKYRRGPNVLDPERCGLYTPNERISYYEDPIEHLRCVNCLRSMNSHINLKFKVPISDLSLEYHQRIFFYDDMIADTDIVILISQNYAVTMKNGESERDVKSTLDMFLQHLSTYGMKVKDIAKLDTESMMKNIYKKCFIENCPLEDKHMFEDYLQNPAIGMDTLESSTRIHEVVIH